MKKKAFTLVEVVVATLVLAIAMLGYVSSFQAYQNVSNRINYRYTAFNLAREVLEWVESGNLPHPVGWVYMWNGATNCVNDFEGANWGLTDVNPWNQAPFFCIGRSSLGGSNE